MGAWSIDAFGNDTACDWAQGLAEVDDLSLVEQALAAVVDAPPGVLDASLACEALAAVEVLARLRGQATERNAYTEPVDDWAARTRLVPPEPLLQRALAALRRIGGDDSELRALWSETDSAAAWAASLDELAARLRAAPLPLPAPLDATSRLVRRIGQLPLDVGHFSPALEAPPAGLAPGTLAAVARQQRFALVLAAEALGEPQLVRAAIASLWAATEQEGLTKVLWDLAVREAKTWAAEGRLDLALAGLAPWRETAESLGPGTFDGRCLAVCQEAGDHAQAERLRDGLIAAGLGAALQRADRVLLAVRARPLAEARQRLVADAADFQAPGLQPWLAFARGILAVRSGEAGGLALLTAWVQERLEACETGQAMWPFFGIGAGWWALALHREGGRTADAQAALAALRPLLLTRENALLVDELKAAGLLAADTALRCPAPSPEAELPGREASHGSFRSVAVRGVNALQQLQAWRQDYAAGRSRRYPFLIGDAADLEQLLESLEPPDAAAPPARVDAAEWLRAHGAAKLPRWRDSGAVPARQLQTPYEVLSGRLKPLMFTGLVELDDPAELFARLGYGGWNGCPEANVHVALHRHWRERYGAEVVAVSESVVECQVARPPSDRKAALALAVEQRAYCDDIVEQGVGSTAALAATLLDSPVWYFWWD